MSQWDDPAPSGYFSVIYLVVISRIDIEAKVRGFLAPKCFRFAGSLAPPAFRRTDSTPASHQRHTQMLPAKLTRLSEPEIECVAPSLRGFSSSVKDRVWHKEE
jgi:hypothetical protein